MSPEDPHLNQSSSAGKSSRDVDKAPRRKKETDAQHEERRAHVHMLDHVPEAFHFGWRIHKTGLAAFICSVFSYGMGGYPFFAVVAALICMKPTLEDSLQVGWDRIIGTCIGGMMGMVMLYLFKAVHLDGRPLLFHFFTILAMMVLIKIIVIIRHNQAVVITCVVYSSILLMPHGPGQSIMQYSMLRILDTLLGVVVALIINELLPNHYVDKEAEAAANVEDAQHVAQKAEADLEKKEDVLEKTVVMSKDEDKKQ